MSIGRVQINIFVLLCFIISLSISISSRHCHADSFEHNGQISVWGACNDNIDGKSGVRYIPEITVSKNLNKELTIDAEVSLELKDNAGAEFYRSWIRLSGNQYEARVGLQRINFGPARILHSLQWFDQIDPRDPLELTDGVYALLGRYYFLNNSNIWTWAMDARKPEFGGRYQFPAPKGEIAFTYHHGRVASMDDDSENRYAIDGSFDLGIGLWSEAILNKKYLTVGADYTFDTGPGVHVLGEHSIKSAGHTTSAISVDFSTGVLDTITAIGYFDWQKDNFYPNVSWQRAYDKWLTNVTVFHNSSDTDNVYSGTGALCTVAYNY
ncbi:MAG: hypothetical protein ABII25_09440 [bacterium]